MTYKITARKGDSEGYDACCGASVITLTDDSLPSPHKENSVLYVYARCRNCGATWRDGFKNGNTTTYNTPRNSMEIGVDTAVLSFEFSHIDTNKAHQGTVDIVEHPTNHPLEDFKNNEWLDSEIIESEWENHRREEYERRKTWVYRFSEVDMSSISPVAVGESYRYIHPELLDESGKDKNVVLITVTDIGFDSEWNIETISMDVTYMDCPLEEIPEISAQSVTVNKEFFMKNAELTETISGRPSS